MNTKAIQRLPRRGVRRPGETKKARSRRLDHAWRLLNRMASLLLAGTAGLFCEVAQAQNAGWDCLLANSTPEANANVLHGMTFHIDRFVAVGDSGTVMVSTNANQWFRQPTPTQSALYGVTASEAQFVVVGDAGCVLVSTNSFDWTLADSGLPCNLRAVAFGNGVYVALTDRYQLLVSSDASAWQPSTNGLRSETFVGLYFGGDRFVAYGPGASLATSADGLNWSVSDLSVATFFSCGAYGGGVFVVAGHEDFSTLPRQVLWSTDGLVWTAESFSSPNGLWSGLCYGQGHFVGVDANEIICSTDGRGWGTCGGGYPDPYAGLMAYGLGKYVALGERGLIYTSTNLYDWGVGSAPVCPMPSVACGNGVCVGTDGSSVYTSVDGVHFVAAPGPIAGLTPVTFANGLFVAGGASGIVVSLDGTNWSRFPAPCSDAVGAVKYGNGMWVGFCRGFGSIFSSTDATNWAVRVASPGYMLDMAYGANRWVIWGWDKTDGVIWSSPDGIQWQNCRFAGRSELGPISIQDGLFSIYSATGYLIPETAFVSYDGVHWTDAGTSGPLLAIHQEALPNPPLFSLAGKWGGIYSLQRSLDLSHWSDLLQITNGGGVTSLPITNPATERSTYFRAAQR